MVAMGVPGFRKRAAGCDRKGARRQGTDGKVQRFLGEAGPCISTECSRATGIQHRLDERDCWIRGRMDLVVPGDVPRVVDYKYATWRGGVEANYEIQMTAYSLALMKAFGTQSAVGELWYLKSPMKIVRREYTFAEADERLRTLMSNYRAAIETNQWPAAERSYCDRVECGFRARCWAS